MLTDKLKNWPYLVASLCQNYDCRERHHGYYGLEVPCSVFPGRWAESPAGRQPLQCILSVQSMLVLEQPSPLDLQKTHKTQTLHQTEQFKQLNYMISMCKLNLIRTAADLDLADVETTASTAAVSPGATEARAVLPGPTSLTV